MRPDVTANQQTALAASPCVGAWLVRLDIIDDPVYAWTGPADLTWDSKAWTGVGDMGTISSIDADSKGNLNGMEMELTGLTSTLLASIKATKYQGQLGFVYFVPLDTDDFTIIDDPFLMFSGEISSMTMVSGKENHKKVSVSLESYMSILGKARPRYRTDEDQQREHSGDTFYEYVVKVLNKTIYWGMKQATSSRSGNAGAGRGGRDATFFRLQ